MTEIDPGVAVRNQQIAAQAEALKEAAAKAAGEKKETNAVAGDFETFLTLLTTQLKNQDPLKPLESTEFVAQLATFSGVEQQVRTNDQLEKIFDAMAGGSQGGLAAWIGKEVRAPARLAYSGVPVEIEMTPVAGADAAEVVIRNDFNQVVARRAVDPRAVDYSWDGRTVEEQGLPDGTYSFSVESFQAGVPLGEKPALAFDKVREIRIEEGVSKLLLAGGGKVTLDEVTALR